MGTKVKYFNVIETIVKDQGFKGFYKGALAAGSGSIVYRATGFSVFELFFTKWEQSESMRRKIPYSGDLELRTAAAGFLSGSFRAILECPFEYIKVRR